MKNLAYIYITEDMTPRSAADKLKMAKESGFEDIIVLHEEDAPFYTTQYKEKLLALFRGAYRSKVRLYIRDDSYYVSGTGFGQVCSVRDVRLKGICKKKISEVAEGEEIIAEKGDECVVKFVFDDDVANGFDFYPDVTSRECAELVIDCVYAPLLREYNKFKGYEFAGFYCNNPCALTAPGGRTAYMDAVVERFESEHKRLPDFFDLAEKKSDFEEYKRLAELCVEENFLEVLKDYCEANGVELAVGSIFDTYADFCRKHNLSHTSICSAAGSYQMYADDAGCVLGSPIEAIGCVMRIAPNMGKLAKLWSFLKKNADAEYVKAEDLNNTDKDCYIIQGNNLKSAVSFLLEGEWCILDWENDAIYDFDKKGVYDFGSSGFLCIRRKSADMYTEKLPVRVGGVLTKELEYVKPVEFVQEGNKFKFILPEESLSGKYINISVSCGYLKLKMGYNSYECITYPNVFPLYDFLCGAECEGVLDEGELREIAIYEKRQ